MRVSPYAKTIVAAIGAFAAAAATVVTDDVVTTNELIVVVLAVLSALGVYVVPNARPSVGEDAVDI